MDNDLLPRRAQLAQNGNGPLATARGGLLCNRDPDNSGQEKFFMSEKIFCSANWIASF